MEFWLSAMFYSTIAGILGSITPERVMVKRHLCRCVKRVSCVWYNGFSNMALMSTLWINITEVLCTMRLGREKLTLLRSSSTINPVLNPVDRELESSLTAAIDHPYILRLLLNTGADPNIPGQQGRSPIFIAAIQGSAEVIQDLIRADLHSRDDHR